MVQAAREQRRESALEEALRGVAATLADVDLVVLFGSEAAGRPHSRSDVDVGVLVLTGSDDERRYAALRRTELALGGIAGGTGRQVDVVDLATAPPQVRFEIARSGRPLAEAVPGAWVRFKTRAMIDWWDWAPTARQLHRAAVERLRQAVSDGR